MFSERSLVLSLVRQARTWSPRHLHLSHLPCLSLSQAAAASRASGHSRPQPPSHIEHTPPPFFFSLFYTVTSSRWTGSALATPPLTPPEVSGTHDRARTQTRTFLYLLGCVRHQQCLAVRPAHAGTATDRVQTHIYAAFLQGQITGSVTKALPGDVNL